MAVFTDANDADQNDLFEFDQTTGKIRKVGVLLGHSWRVAHAHACART